MVFRGPEETFGFLGIDLAQDDLGIFEPEDEHQIETDYLGIALDEAVETIGLDKKEPSLLSFRSFISELEMPLPILVTWADDFRIAYQDELFSQTAEGMRVYLPLFTRRPN